MAMNLSSWRRNIIMNTLLLGGWNHSVIIVADEQNDALTQPNDAVVATSSGGDYGYKFGSCGYSNKLSVKFVILV